MYEIMKIFKIKAICFTGLFLGLAQASAVGFTLDAFNSFETGETFQEVFLNDRRSGDSNPSRQTGLMNVFGEERYLNVTEISGGGNISLFIDTYTDINSATANVANFSVDAGTVGEAEIRWDGFDGLPNTDAIDITEGNTQNSFEIKVIDLNIGTDPDGTDDLTLNFEIGDTNNNTAKISRTFTSGLGNSTIGGAVSVYFPYQDRVENDINNPVSLQNIDYIRFYTSDDNSGDDFIFNFIQSSELVPFEFSPGLGLILGGSFFTFLRLRKNFQQN